jgi:hypothetical protein
VLVPFANDCSCGTPRCRLLNTPLKIVALCGSPWPTGPACCIWSPCFICVNIHKILHTSVLSFIFFDASTNWMVLIIFWMCDFHYLALSDVALRCKVKCLLVTWLYFSVAFDRQHVTLTVDITLLSLWQHVTLTVDIYTVELLTARYPNGGHLHCWAFDSTLP